MCFIIYLLLYILLKYIFKILFRENNNDLVPVILNRLESYYTEFCEEYEINQSLKPFSHLNNGQTNYDSCSIKPSPKKKSNFSYFGLIGHNLVFI